MSTCHCIFRHAITDEEKALTRRALEQARREGDSIGMIIHTGALQACYTMGKVRREKKP